MLDWIVAEAWETNRTGTVLTADIPVMDVTADIRQCIPALSNRVVYYEVEFSGLDDTARADTIEDAKRKTLAIVRAYAAQMVTELGGVVTWTKDDEE